LPLSKLNGKLEDWKSLCWTCMILRTKCWWLKWMLLREGPFPKPSMPYLRLNSINWTRGPSCRTILPRKRSRRLRNK
jgi:hypothetical protein